MSTTHRILVSAHAHPDFSLGGGEIAAHNLFRAYLEASNVEAAWFLGRADKGRGPTGIISRRRDNEYLWEQSIFDWHGMHAANRESLTTWFADLVRSLKPTIVHSHHYAHLGLEHFKIIKSIDPDLKLVLTLHEYMAICLNNGQMIKTGSRRLCTRESYDDCHSCFPEKSPEEFWLRKHTFTRHFDLVDHFISPSEFLKQRYTNWGIPASKISVIENGQNEAKPLPPRPMGHGQTRNRFGYFGQINPFKGLLTVLEALELMSDDQRRSIVLEIHGANLDIQEESFRNLVQEKLKPLIESGTVVWVGPYRPEDLPSRLKHVDWVLIPSVWWENSPMVIQEAFVYGRPVIGSNIGGMAEKIHDGVNGLHVSVGNKIQWADTLLKAAKFDKEWEALRSGIVQPLTHTECANCHLQLFEEVFYGISAAHRQTSQPRNRRGTAFGTI